MPAGPAQDVERVHGSEAMERQKSYYDEEVYQAGSLVWLNNPTESLHCIGKALNRLVLVRWCHWLVLKGVTMGLQNLSYPYLCEPV
ncbi:hypothetical protein CRENBAI_001542 [Crenichthys baileyi]|uniref:Uncharacterized protein n=1 Tax=Crenichthys baileyi TaxID=28760 RepID=A0AAV9S2G0_9TELE